MSEPNKTARERGLTVGATAETRWNGTLYRGVIRRFDASGNPGIDVWGNGPNFPVSDAYVFNALDVYLAQKEPNESHA